VLIEQWQWSQVSLLSSSLSIKVLASGSVSAQVLVLASWGKEKKRRKKNPRKFLKKERKIEKQFEKAKKKYTKMEKDRDDVIG
jgi:hypothetical protein